MKIGVQLLTLYFVVFSNFLLAQTPLFSDIPASDVPNASIGNANTSRNVAIDSEGNIYVVFNTNNEIRVSKSTDRGANFSPSVLVAEVGFESEVAVNSDGIVFVAWESNGIMMLARSLNEGISFETPQVIGTSSGVFTTAVHINTEGTNVYLVDTSGSNFYSNRNNGEGAFNRVTLSSFVFADVLSNEIGTVYLVRDNPVLEAYVSNDFGATLNEINLVPGGSVFFSSYTFSEGPCGEFVFVAGGGNDGQGYRIDITNGNTSQISFGSSTNNQGRTLVADNQGTLIDGYFSNGDLVMSISQDQGSSFDSPITIAQGNSHNIARSDFYNDVVVVYETGGNIFVNVYDDILKSIRITDDDLEFCGNQVNFKIPFEIQGLFDSNTLFTVELSDINGDFTNSTVIGQINTNVSGEIDCTLPNDLAVGNYRIRVTSRDNCIQSTTINLAIVSAVANQIDPQRICDDNTDGFLTIDLSQFNADILGSQNPNEFNVTYHDSQEDADSGDDPFPINYTNQQALTEETIFIRVENALNSTCFTTSSFIFEILEKPEITNTNVEITNCETDGDGMILFDLTQANEQIVVDVTGLTFTYFSTLEAAQNQDTTFQINPDFNIDISNFPSGGNVFVNVQNDDSSCTDVATITLNYNVVSIGSVDPQRICDDDTDGFLTIDLSQFNAGILGSQNPNEFNVTYHDSQEDADSGDDPLPINYTNQQALTEETIFVRIETLDNQPSCFLTTSFPFEVLEKPEITNANAVLTNCETDDDGMILFDLTQANEQIVVDVTGLTFTYFSTLEAAQNQDTTFQINSEFNIDINNFPSGSNVFVNVQNDDSSCSDVATITLNYNVVSNGIINDILGSCDSSDDILDNDMASFDLTTFESIALDIIGSNVNLSYYMSIENAESGTNNIPNPENHISEDDEIFVRGSVNGSCFGIARFNIVVLDNPTINNEPEFDICLGSDNTIESIGDFDRVEWYLEGNPSPLNSNGGTIISIQETGTYTILAFNDYNNIIVSGGNSFCTTSFNVDVRFTDELPVVTDVVIVQNESIRIIGDPNNQFPPFEYKIDDLDWQPSSRFDFDNFEPGLHTALIRNDLGCLSNTFEFVIINVNNFITPNGDGKNDVWVIEGLDLLEGSMVKIFDRYGKTILTKTITNGQAFEWNGTYLGRILPSGDYWYIIELNESSYSDNVLTGHITIKNQ